MSRRPFDREQAWLLPPELGDLVPADHPARFVAAFVDSLRPALAQSFGIGSAVGEGVGAPAYAPQALLAVWVYGFMTGVRSSRKLELACRERVPFLWLSGRQCPDHNTLWRFYKRHRLQMRDLLKTTVHTAVKLGLVDLALQAIDGTKIEGNASRFRVMDAESLWRLLVRTEQAIRDLEAQNEAGDDPPPPSLPQELAQAQTLRERLRAAWASMEESGQQRVNLTDPDVRTMKGNRGPVSGYNAQAVAAPLLSEEGAEGQLIIAVDVVTDANDAYQLAPMMAHAEEMTGEQARITLADAGYHSGEALAACVDDAHQVVMPESQDRALNHPYHKDASPMTPRGTPSPAPKASR